MVDGESNVVVGGQGTPAAAAPKGRRFAAAIVDLFFIPIALGMIAGFILLPVPEGIRNVLLVLINIAWLLFRDTVFAPGRRMVGVRLVSTTGEKVTLGQAFIRNILLIIPFVLVIGYIIEIVFLATKGHRLADTWAGTQVVVA